jgi:hypothetical protein
MDVAPLLPCTKTASAGLSIVIAGNVRSGGSLKEPSAVFGRPRIGAGINCIRIFNGKGANAFGQLLGHLPSFLAAPMN